MGTWTIVIEGHGLNHNLPAIEKDADEMARKFVKSLINAGHAEVRGVFVYGPKLIKNGTIERACFEEQQKLVQQGMQDRVKLEPPVCTWPTCSRTESGEGPHTHYVGNQMEPLGGSPQ
jgi:hypothetical protein